jgi:hypothetical protein
VLNASLICEAMDKQQLTFRPENNCLRLLWETRIDILVQTKVAKTEKDFAFPCVRARFSKVFNASLMCEPMVLL